MKKGISLDTAMVIIIICILCFIAFVAMQYGKNNLNRTCQEALNMSNILVVKNVDVATKIEYDTEFWLKNIHSVVTDRIICWKGYCGFVNRGVLHYAWIGCHGNVTKE